MNINLEFDAQALAAPQSFRDGMEQAASTLDAEFTDSITVNITVGYGEFLGGSLPNQNTSEANIDYQGVDGQGITTSYQNFRNLLIAHAASSDQQTAVANLPNVTDLPGHSGNYIMGSAQAKALGVLSANDSALDGAVGMGTNFTGSVLYNGALHELTHALGRIAGTTLDIFRFNENGTLNHVFGGSIPATPAYFSIDGGHTKLADFGINSDPGDWLNSGVQGNNDPYDEIVGLGGLSSVDITVMNVLGFSISPAPPPAPPSPPVSTHHFVGGSSDFDNDGKADVFWQNDNGQVYEWLMNGMSVAGAGTPGLNSNQAWHVVGSGDFNGDGKSDVLWQNSDSGHVYEWQMNGMSVAAAGFAGSNTTPAWHVAAIGDYNGDGKSDVLWQNSDSGHVYEWQMNGLSVTNAGTPAINSTPAWHVTGAG